MNKDHELTNEEIKALAECERKMDSGELKYVFLNPGRNRVAVSAEIIEQLDLKHGQTINSLIFLRILELNLANAQAQMAIDNAKNK